MATKTLLQTLQGCLCSCFGQNDDDDTISTTSSLRPLLCRTPPLRSPLQMPLHTRRAPTYGKKKPAVNPAAAAIFGSAANKSPSPSREPLADVTEALNNLKVEDHESSLNKASRDESSEESDENYISDIQVRNDEVKSDTEDISTPIPPPKCLPPALATQAAHLEPLTKAYEIDRKEPLIGQLWDELLPTNCAVEKIAEASYAEVYRVTTGDVSSIIKIMPLKVPNDPSCLENPTAIRVEDVVSEIRIMNLLTEVPGCVTFKDAHLVQGKPNAKLAQAHIDWVEFWGEETYFLHPSEYTRNSMFLAIELGDAGTSLDKIEIESIDMVWDIFLGTVMALSRAENHCEFEHRDLHENNICCYYKRNPYTEERDPQDTLRFGFSGVEVTIIDYGLSRATLPSGEIMFNDLEADLELFHGDDGNMQYDTYRRMRTHLFTGERTMKKSPWHVEVSRSANNGHTWSEFSPYTNVLWIKFLLSYLIKAAKKAGVLKWEMTQLNDEVRELNRRLNVRTKIENGAFSTAADILEFAAAQGWVNDQQIESYGVDITVLSDYFTD